MSTPVPASESAVITEPTAPVPPPQPAAISAETGADALTPAGRPRWLDRVAALMMCGTAVSYYLSAVLHIAGYAGAALMFYLLGFQFLDDESWLKTPIRASLDDEELRDDQPQFELTPEIDLGVEEQKSSTQLLSQHLRISDAGWIDTLDTDALSALSSAGTDENSNSSGDGFFFQMPKAGLAVTKGSFTAWTEPNSPRPGENYLIIIEVRLPDDVTRYRVADLVGEVKGTDDYRQRIPYDTRARSAAAASTEDGLKVIESSTVLDVVNNKIQLAIRVPGAARLVKDTITIRSRRLREEQELILIFGQAPGDDE